MSIRPRFLRPLCPPFDLKMHPRWDFYIAENVQGSAFAFHIRHSFWGSLSAQCCHTAPLSSFSRTKYDHPSFLFIEM